MGTVSLHDIFNRISFNDTETVSLGWLRRRLSAEDGDGWEVNLDPDYQRGRVWTDDQAGKFVGHFIEGGHVPDVIFNRSASFTGIPDEVVDGKQRITALWRWLNNEIPAILTDGREVYFDDLDAESQRYACSYSGPTFTIGYVSLSRPEVLRLYLRLNRGGTVHTDDEIERVRALLAEEG